MHPSEGEPWEYDVGVDGDGGVGLVLVMVVRYNQLMSNSINLSFSPSRYILPQRQLQHDNDNVNVNPFNHISLINFILPIRLSHNRNQHHIHNRFNTTSSSHHHPLNILRCSLPRPMMNSLWIRNNLIHMIIIIPYLL